MQTTTKAKTAKHSNQECRLTLGEKNYRYDYEELEMQQALLATRTLEHRYDQLQLRGSVDMQTDIDNDGTYATLRAVAYLLKREAEDGTLLPFSKHDAESEILPALMQLKGPDQWKVLEDVKKNFFLKQKRQLLLSNVDLPCETHAINQHNQRMWEAYAQAERRVQHLTQNADGHNSPSSNGNEHGTLEGTQS